MKYGESLEHMITTFNTVVHELISQKKVTSEEQVEKVLGTLPRSTAISEAKDLTNQTVDELVGNLKIMR